MVEIGNVKEVIKDYIIKQLVSMGESSPAIRLLIPLAKRAITNNINSFDKFLKPIADKDGMIDIEGIFNEEMEIINNIDNFDFDIPFIGGGNQNILDEFREFLDARGGRGGRGSRGGMRNRIGYDTYDTYGRPTNKNDREEKILTMLMSGGYNDDGYHFNEYEAKEVVEQMYHVKDNKKYIGEKYDMNKAHEICERYKEVLPNDVEPCDVYVAINAQYHDYAKLFEEWFGGNIDNKVFESAITFWFKDVDFDGDKVWEYFHMNN